MILKLTGAGENFSNRVQDAGLYYSLSYIYIMGVPTLKKSYDDKLSRFQASNIPRMKEQIKVVHRRFSEVPSVIVIDLKRP